MGSLTTAFPISPRIRLSEYTMSYYLKKVLLLEQSIFLTIYKFDCVFNLRICQGGPQTSPGSFSRTHPLRLRLYPKYILSVAEERCQKQGLRKIVAAGGKVESSQCEKEKLSCRGS